jgi:hypothetical protein
MEELGGVIIVLEGRNVKGWRSFALELSGREFLLVDSSW